MEKKISLKVLVDKKKKRVVLAEAGGDFVDVLFSFLTLPLGSIVRLLGKNTGLGSLDALYKSVEQLDADHLLSEGCRDMLLHPRSEAAELCENLKVANIHDPNFRRFFTCKKESCCAQYYCNFSYIPNVLCLRCKEPMDKPREWKNLGADKGIFIKAQVNFMITDDLQVFPISFLKGCSILDELGIKDECNLEERFVDFGTEELTKALNLLRRSLVSNSVLSEICFPNACQEAISERSSWISEKINDHKIEEGSVMVKLAMNKKNNNVIFAEVGDDFINQLLSYLTFPLGTVLNLLADNRSLGGCISNLYSSVESMGLHYFKTEFCKGMLMAPKLASFQKYFKQMLKVDVKERYTKPFSASCMNIENIIEFKEVHGPWRGFAGECKMFMVADDLQISPLTFISTISKAKIQTPISDLIVKDVRFSTADALSLLRAMLMSKTVLTDVFSFKANKAAD